MKSRRRRLMIRMARLCMLEVILVLPVTGEIFLVLLEPQQLVKAVRLHLIFTQFAGVHPRQLFRGMLGIRRSGTYWITINRGDNYYCPACFIGKH